MNYDYESWKRYQAWKTKFLVEMLMVRIRQRELTITRSRLPPPPVRLAAWADSQLSDREYIEAMFNLYTQQRYRLV
jgi:hypothetical protein